MTAITTWNFLNPVRIHFGRGSRGMLVDELRGKRCLVVSTKRGRRQFSDDPVLGLLSTESSLQWMDSVTENPGIEDLQVEIDRRRKSGYDAIIAFGGGSAIDSAKILAVAMSRALSGISLVDLLADPSLHESVKPHPLYAVPTTAGTGSEVTPFSTIWDHAKYKKHSMAGAAIYPYMAIVDPALTDTVPRAVTISTGLDALNQAMESVWNRNATPATIDLATRAIRLGLEALPRLAHDRNDPTDRDKMSEASLLAGIAISRTRTALCHSISYPITAHFGVPHGLACAFTMAAVFRLNLGADDGRLSALAAALDCPDVAILGKAIDDLLERCEVQQQVRGMIGQRTALFDLLDEMYTPGRADNNLAPVDLSVIEKILAASWRNSPDYHAGLDS